MLAIEIEYLTGRAVACSYHDRTQAEWPPHPQRLFSALVAAHSELDLGERGAAALRWMEALEPPQMVLDLAPGVRQALGHWVPVNDEAICFDANKPTNFQHPLDRRTKQERYFPSVLPSDRRVTFQWPVAAGIEQHRAILTHMVEGLSYLGHSSAPVRACLREHVALPTLVPDNLGDTELRVPGPGRFDRLESIHALRQKDESVQPPVGRVVRYRELADMTPTSEFAAVALLAFEDGPKLGLAQTAGIAELLRRALLKVLPDDAPAVLTGHDAPNQLSKATHLAIAPMAFVDSQYADGAVKGLALLLPRSADAHARMLLDEAIYQITRLNLGGLGTLALRRIDVESDEMLSLRWHRRYAVASKVWQTVTPIIAERFPKKQLSLEEIIADSLRFIGLPRPIAVTLTQAPLITGSPHSKNFGNLTSGYLSSRLRVHARLTFAQAVRGPLLIGAGRFLGLGLCLPISERNL